ncbi:hypothetical protein KY316_00700 [Candidatus Woesearchaeota archaeon]|nr:hypothetical protein [Candidatus Woesearchaeota archaeon]
MNKVLRDIIAGTGKFVTDFAGWFFGLSNYTNHRVVFEFWKDVESDIYELVEGLDDSKFERDKNPEFVKVVEKYRKKYCPCPLYRWFSPENEYKYMEYRIVIDELLKKAESPFSDFLSPREAIGRLESLDDCF